MRFAEFFAGIGGFRLGLERAGHACVWACEIAPFPREVYRERFGAEPDAADLLAVDPASVPASDLWAGGFPCQDVSAAGKRAGLDRGVRLAGPRGVRRLTPRECERLQGFPDDWTATPGASDAQRYRALGNAVAVPVIEWIGRRLPV